MADSTAPSRARAWSIIRLVGSLALVGWLIWGFDWRAAWEALQRLTPAGALALLGGMLLNRLLAFYRFWVLLRREGVAIERSTAIRLGFLAMFVSNFLPSTVGGDVTKIGWLARRGYSGLRAAFWALFDRLSNMLAVTALTPFALVLPPVRAAVGRVLNGWHPDHSTALGLSLAVALAAALLLFALPRWNPPAAAREEDPARGLLHRGRAVWRALLERRETYGVLAGLSVLSILPFLGGTWVAARDLGMTVSLGEVTGIYAILYWITLLPIAVNGLGLQEVSTVYLFQSVGAGEASAVALAVLTRVVIWISTLPGALWMGMGIRSTEVAPGPDDPSPGRS